MSDFFSHLAEQTLGLAPTVQPMIAPLFAPARQTPILNNSIATNSEEQSVTDALFSERSVQSHGGRSTHFTNTMPFYPTVRDNSHEAIFLDSVSSQSEQAPAIQPLVLRAHVSASNNAALHVTTQPYDASLIGVDEKKQTKTAVETDTQHHTSSGKAPQHPVEEAVIKAARHAFVVSDVRKQEPSANRQVQQTLEPSAETSERAPTIYVSIGRVDVRAVLPPTTDVSRPTPNRSTPVLSLEEYLKQQKREKR